LATGSFSRPIDGVARLARMDACSDLLRKQHIFWRTRRLPEKFQPDSQLGEIPSFGTIDDRGCWQGYGTSEDEKL
jgi:hypothetical protein